MILKLILLVVLIVSLCLMGATTVRIIRAYNKRRLLADGNSVTSDAQDCAGISALCSGVYNLSQLENLLDVEYSRYEVVLVIDSVHDKAFFRTILSHYQMSMVNYDTSFELPSSGVRGMYRSRKRCYRRLIIVNKVHTTPEDDLDVAAGVASYDYLLPVCDNRWLLPKAIERIVVEMSERPHAPYRMVQSLMGEPTLVILRENVVEADGFGEDMFDGISGDQIKTLYEPLMYACCYTPNRRAARLRFVSLLLLLVGAVVSAWFSLWALTAVLITLSAICSMVRYLAPVVLPFEAYNVDCVVAMKYFLRRLTPKSFRIS